MPPRPIAILVCGRTVPPLVPRRGDFPDWFRAGLGLDAALAPAIDLPSGAEPPPIEDLAGAVVTGSPAMFTGAEPWSLGAEAWLARAHRGGLPILAVCYGHQLLARALDGAADWNPRGREIGTVEVELTEAGERDSLLGGLGSPLVVQESHSQSVTRLPDGAVLLAANARDPHQAFRLGERSWGVQFHPEFDAEIMRGYLAHRAGDLREEGLDPAALADATRDSPHGAAILGRFAALAHGE